MIMLNWAVLETAADVVKLKVKNPQKLAFVTQTTLSVDDTSVIIDALRHHFPAIEGPRKDDICYATQNRQDTVKRLAKQCDLVLVVGSENSSNSTRLCELATKLGTTAYLIDTERNIMPDWLIGKKTIGLTAGASAPEVLVQAVVKQLQVLGGKVVMENPGVEENIVFEVPPELRIKQVD